jgi:tRNA G37 N-methylase TrmD
MLFIRLGLKFDRAQDLFMISGGIEGVDERVYQEYKKG